MHLSQHAEEPRRRHLGRRSHMLSMEFLDGKAIVTTTHQSREVATVKRP
jgi:hypothetical protein